jgi:competence protein ComEC
MGQRSLAASAFALAFVVGLSLLVGVVSAEDCIVPATGAGKTVTLRGAPTASAKIRGTLSAGQGLPLVASMSGWYETRLADGQPAFAAKRSTDLEPCPAPIGAAPASTGVTFELHVIDVGTGLSVVVRGADFALLYDAGSNDDMARGDSNRTIAYLKTLSPQLEKIDHVILSHPHRDHVELLPDVVTRFKPSEVEFGCL